MRYLLTAVGILFIAVGCFTPVEGNRWVSKEPVGLPPGKWRDWGPERKTVEVRHDSKVNMLVMKYSAFVLGCGLIYVSWRKPSPPDPKGFRRWVRKRKKLRERLQ